MCYHIRCLSFWTDGATGPHLGEAAVRQLVQHALERVLLRAQEDEVLHCPRPGTARVLGGRAALRAHTKNATQDRFTAESAEAA